MKKSFLVGITIGILMFGMAGAASSDSVDMVINFSGTNALFWSPPEYSAWSPVAVELDPGTYSLKPVKHEIEGDGILYNGAYNFGSGYGFSSGYSVATKFQADITNYYSGHTTQSTIEEAFKYAMAGSFTISEKSTIYFGVHDSYYPDNSGGISLRLTGSLSSSSSVPEPATMILFGFGLLGVAGISRRKK